MSYANGTVGSEARSVIALLDYIQPEIRLIDPIAAFLVSVSLDLLNGRLPSLDHPCDGCRPSQGEPREAESRTAVESSERPRRAADRVVRLPRLRGV